MQTILVGQTEGKKPLTKSTRRWEDNIKMDRKEMDATLWTLVGCCENDKEHFVL